MGDVAEVRPVNGGVATDRLGSVEATLLLAECDLMLSGGDGKVIAASILGKPGESGCIWVCGTSSVLFTEIFAGFFCCLGDLTGLRRPELVFGNAESATLDALSGDRGEPMEAPALCGRGTIPGKLECCESVGGGVFGRDMVWSGASSGELILGDEPKASFTIMVGVGAVVGAVVGVLVNAS